MSDFYAVYKYKDQSPSYTVEDLLAEVYKGLPEFVRWEWTDAYFPGILFKDIHILEQGYHVVYIYIKDKTVLPFHSDEEIKDVATDKLQSYFSNDATNVKIEAVRLKDNQLVVCVLSK